MADTTDPSGRTKRLILQQLESWQRAGVAQLVRKPTAPRHGAQLRHLPPRPLPPRAEPPHGAEYPPQADVPAGASLPAARVSPLETEPLAEPVVSVPVVPAVSQEPNMARRGGSTLESRRTELAVVEQEVSTCRRCEHLACTRTQTVFGVGNLRPRLCFMGEAPGADEDRQGEPFVGRAGQLLTDIIHKGMGLQRSDVYILNVLKCRPPNNRVPTDDEIANCREYFERQLAILQPEFICCLGATAVRALLNKTSALGRLRGQWFDYGGARVIVTYHPSYLLRQPAAKKDTWEDIQLLMREMGLPTATR